MRQLLRKLLFTLGFNRVRCRHCGNFIRRVPSRDQYCWTHGVLDSHWIGSICPTAHIGYGKPLPTTRAEPFLVEWHGSED